MAASHDLARGPQGHGLARRARAPALPAPVPSAGGAGGISLWRGSVLSIEYFPSS